MLVCRGSNQVLSDLQVSPQGHGTQVRFRGNSLYYRTDGFGVLSKVRWMKERPLGGMRPNEEYLQALQKFKQESSEEGSEQWVGGRGTVLEWMLERMDEGMTALLQEAKRQDVAAVFSVIYRTALSEAAVQWSAFHRFSPVLKLTKWRKLHIHLDHNTCLKNKNQAKQMLYKYATMSKAHIRNHSIHRVG